MKRTIFVVGKVDKIFVDDFKHYLIRNELKHLHIVDILKIIFKKEILLQTSGSRYVPLHKLRKFGFKIYNMDRKSFSEEPWEWHRLINNLEEIDYKRLRLQSKNRLCNRFRSLKRLKHSKSYIFGTGPSLEKSSRRLWKNGYRIVCNTIVRDKKLWNHIQPDFIVAGDALYHFSNTQYALAFRADLEKRLCETKTYFVYPETYHQYLLTQIDKKLLPRLIPIPGSDKTDITTSLCKDFRLPGNENVLGLLLLPLACNLSRNIYLWGFDGRAPNDKDFWSNSKLHSYSESIDSLKKHSPAFFESNIPKSHESTYADRVQGVKLDKILVNAEKLGYKFYMMHSTWSKALLKRCIKQYED